MTRPKKELYDVIIIGGGAAGTACAALTSKAGLNVLILERAMNLGLISWKPLFYPGFGRSGSADDPQHQEG